MPINLDEYPQTSQIVLKMLGMAGWSRTDYARWRGVSYNSVKKELETGSTKLATAIELSERLGLRFESDQGRADVGSTRLRS